MPPLDRPRPEDKNADAGDARGAAGIARIVNYDGAMPAAGLQSQNQMTARPSVLTLIAIALAGGLILATTLGRWGVPMSQDQHGSDYTDVSEDGKKLYVSRRYEADLRPFAPGPKHDFAEVTIRAEATEKETEVLLSPAAAETLRSVFGEDFDYQRHNVLAAAKFLIAAANIRGEHPHVGASSFRVEVARIRVSRNAGQEASGALLTSATWGAVGAFLTDWEKSRECLSQSDGR